MKQKMVFLFLLMFVCLKGVSEENTAVSEESTTPNEEKQMSGTELLFDLIENGYISINEEELNRLIDNNLLTNRGFVAILVEKGVIEAPDLSDLENTENVSVEMFPTASELGLSSEFMKEKIKQHLTVGEVVGALVNSGVIGLNEGVLRKILIQADNDPRGSICGSCLEEAIRRTW